MGTPNAIRDAREPDCQAIADIYNEAIAEGRSTFETKPRPAVEIAQWLAFPEHPVLVAETDGGVMGWARLAPYSSRACYAGIAEASVYVRASARGRGLGGALAAHLRDHASGAGLHKLLGKVFAENTASRALCARYGFREVGTHLQHGKIDRQWIDVIVVELLLNYSNMDADAACGTQRSEANLRLRPFRVSDERAARAAHTELSKEDFPFLLDWEPDQPWATYTQKLADCRQGIDVDPDRVPATFLAADLAGVLVGRVSIRHELNEFLENFGGHIGYAVRPAYRGRGIATDILRQALIIARSEGTDEVLLTCDEDHAASAHIIERLGGVLEDIRTDSDGQAKRRYWLR